MEDLVRASHEGDINLLYSAIQKDPTILDQIDAIPFVDTPLHVAASLGHVEFAMEVARLKPSFTRKPNLEGFSPMHVAMAEERTELVSWLLALDSELARVKGREGVTPLHEAVRRGQVGAVDVLLSSCFRSIGDVTIRNETVFHVALKNGQMPAFHRLIERLEAEAASQDLRVILNAKDPDGNTALHIAAATNQAQAVESLLKWPEMLPIDDVNKNGQTAMEIAISYRHITIENLLRRVAPKQNSTFISISLGHENKSPLSGDKKIDVPHAPTPNLLVVVAVLIATATYATILTPPGGVDSSTNLSNLASNKAAAYVWFIVFNSAGFFVSMTALWALIHKYPFHWEICVAVIAMEVTYDVVMVSITPKGWMRKISVCLAVAMPVVVGLGYASFRQWLGELSRA